ncbi:MAG TPA: sigma-70 family RNA polymerase sigma factor [Thermoanaerobaculia bacterium]|nr:sigma-70 family RNA polymerase sigma factor [Thermoanaerobaculia bacterium]
MESHSSHGETASSPSSDQTLLAQSLPHVARIVAFLRRRHRLSREEAEDFQSWVHERLLEDGCRRLRVFSGRSKLSTFLVTVVNRLFVDYRRQEWGQSRWTPSAIAVRLGPLAVRLEELWQRDGLSFHEAAAWLVEHAEADRAELEEIAGSLPARPRARLGSLEGSADPVDSAADPETAVLVAERAARFGKLSAALERRLGELPAEDGCILRMHFLEGMTIAVVAEALHLEQRPVYRRRDRLLAEVRAALTADGWNEIEAKRLLDEWRPER